MQARCLAELGQYEEAPPAVSNAITAYRGCEGPVAKSEGAADRAAALLEVRASALAALAKQASH
jgi:hypothetical protein